MKDNETYRRASNSVDNCIKGYLFFPVTFCEKAWVSERLYVVA